MRYYIDKCTFLTGDWIIFKYMYAFDKRIKKN